VRKHETDNRGGLDNLEVLLVGVEALLSRDVARALVADGAIVTAAAGDEQSLVHLQRDLGLYHTTVNIAPIDLFSSSEMQLFADNLRGQRRLPHLIVCCNARRPYPAALALSLLQPSLVLDALPLAATRLGRAVASLNLPALPTLLETSRRPRLFDPETGPQRVLIGGHVFVARRWDGAPVRGRGHRAASPKQDPALATGETPYPAPRRHKR
jgi:hypothetical protein